MSAPRPGRHLILAAATACVIGLAACGSGGDPNTDVTPTESGTGQLGEVTTTPTTDANTPASTATSGGGGGGGGGGGNANPYPDNAKDYGLEMLGAIASGDDAGIVDLSDLNTAQYVQTQNYKSKNGQWTHANCESSNCYYYNETGDIASVGIDTSMLGQASAVTSVNIEGGSYAMDAVGYAQNLAQAWTYDGRYVAMRALATQSVIDALNGKQKLNAGGGGVSAGPTSCPGGLSGTCVSVYAVGGSLTISYVFAVDPSKLGKPNAVTGIS